MSRPVRPRDAASLLLLRNGPTGTEVLMGLRPSRSAFMPSVYVFPGGRVDAADHSVRPAREAHPLTSGILSAQPGPASMAQALANAAIRETFEETGLRLTRPGETGVDAGSSCTWAALSRLGEAPDHGALVYLGRAITPRESPIRFHARFFAADAGAATGDLGASDELSDLAFRPIAEALRLPIIDVTELMLRQVDLVWRDRNARRPFLRYRSGRAMVTFERVPDHG